MLTNGKLLHLPAVASTNDECKALAQAGEPEGAVVWADTQTAGRGRGDHAWASAPGGLYCSLLLRPTELRSVQLLSLLAGLAAVDAVIELAGVNAHLKWPNDIMLGGRKLGGLLCEAHWQGQQPVYAVVGLGLNVNQPDFPPELAGIATSLLLETGQPIDLQQLLQLFLAQFDTEYRAGSLHRPRADLLQSYRSRLGTLGQQVRVDTGAAVIAGKAVDVDESGHLVVETASGRETVVSGTVMND